MTWLMPRAFHRYWVGACLALFGVGASAAQSIPLWTYYADPPFAVEADAAGVSLTVKLAAWLSQQSAGRYRFEARQLPRRRLDLLLEQPDWQGVVAWANPVWFSDEAQNKYLWSRPYMSDADLVVSSRLRPVRFDGIDSLAGLTFGGIAGHRYADLEALLQAGKIVREDAHKERQNLERLRLGRIQVTFLQASSLPYYRHEIADFDRWLYIARQPRSTYARHLFTGRGNQALMQFLNASLDALKEDREWREITPAAQRSLEAARAGQPLD